MANIFIGGSESVRNGRTKLQDPVYISYLGAGEFASSGFRDHLRFVRNGNSTGAYSLLPGARSKVLNRGAVVKVDDSRVSYMVCSLSTREDTPPNPKDAKYGPVLPHSPNPTSSGTISVTASLEAATPQSRAAVDKVMLERANDPKPMRWPFFWTYKHRLTDWLMRDSGPTFYEVSGKSLSAYQQLSDTVEQLNHRGGVYVDHGERFIYGNESRKGNAGAHKVMNRHTMDVGAMVSLHFHLNFLPVTFATQSGRIYFMPDEVIIAELNGQCWFVSYSELKYEITEGTQMGVPVPSWCVPVGYTWQYMNKDGGPDRRYNNNFQIPHYKVWELDFTFPGGRIDTAFADKNLLDRFVRCLETLRDIERGRA
jgi:hypothetical protein